ncbi:conserved hypothetical protein [Alphaproteobacteria bacterium]
MTRSAKNIRAADELYASMAQNSNFKVVHGFQEKYDAIVTEYLSTPGLAVRSIIRVDLLDSFKQWVPEILANKQNVVPFIIANMLEGDIIALDMYDNLYSTANRTDLVLDYMTIHQNSTLEIRFREYGGGEDSRAIISAERWLKSSEAADVLSGDIQDGLCIANEILHTANEYAHC